jgi:hypothetical protein
MLSPTVVIEFYGIPRRRAGRADLVVSAATVREALAAIRASCPGLADLCRSDGSLAAHYLLSRDGEVFVTDLNVPLESGEHLLLLSADAGG